MKKQKGALLISALIVLAVPQLLGLVLDQKKEEIQAETALVTQAETAETVQPLMQEIRLQVLWKGSVWDMELSDYLTGVLLGELPGSFHMEAKKAQAVVARTYALRTVASNDKHPGSVCTDSTCCQAYIHPDDYMASGGDHTVLAQAQQAVKETEKLVLTYQGNLIEATFFSCSGGRTEDAVAVWGTDVPYLQGVDSPGEEIAAHYSDRKVFTPKQFCDTLGIRLVGDPNTWFGKMEYTQGGGVSSMIIGGKAYQGTFLRAALGLRSTAFSVTVENNRIVFTTKGYGHRVGMSQYGAQAMAISGSDFTEILCHYYQGTRLESVHNS